MVSAMLKCVLCLIFCLCLSIILSVGITVLFVMLFRTGVIRQLPFAIKVDEYVYTTTATVTTESDDMW